jgi:uncharacterized phage protein (TIGR01671 family)
MKDNKDDKLDNKKRKIEFRGKCENTNKWEYGLVGITKNGNFLINNSKQHFIDENTLGQFTGLCDKNGKKIYEGDVVKFIDYDSYDEGFENAGVVKYGGNMFYVTNRYSVNMEDLVDDLEGSMYCEVISNIHDDPEMWEEYDEKPNN